MRWILEPIKFTTQSKKSYPPLCCSILVPFQEDVLNVADLVLLPPEEVVDVNGSRQILDVLDRLAGVPHLGLDGGDVADGAPSHVLVLPFVLAVVAPLELLVDGLDALQLLGDFGHLDLGEEVVPLFVGSVDLLDQKFQLVEVAGGLARLLLETEAGRHLRLVDPLHRQATILEEEAFELVFPAVQPFQNLLLVLGVGEHLAKDHHCSPHVVLEFVHFQGEGQLFRGLLGL